jgi:single-strand DNA-binding protein
MIKLQVIGNLGRDCSVNTVNGRSVINFSVAHTERFKDAQGVLQQRTMWVDCAYWTDRTAVAPYLKKGTMVYAEGTPDLRSYQAQDGTTKTSLTLRVQNVQLIGSNRNNDSSGNNSTTSGAATNIQNTASAATDFAPAAEAEEGDDLPF